MSKRLVENTVSASIPQMSTACTTSVLKVRGKEGRILIGPRAYLNRQQSFVEIPQGLLALRRYVVTRPDKLHTVTGSMAGGGFIETLSRHIYFGCEE